MVPPPRGMVSSSRQFVILVQGAFILLFAQHRTKPGTDRSLGSRVRGANGANRLLQRFRRPQKILRICL